MKRTYQFSWILLLLSAFLLMLTNSASVRAAPELTIGHYELVSSKRITRTVFEYTYKADMTNTGSDALEVSATLSVDAPGVTVLDGQLSFGNVAAGARVKSSDTFAIRQDRSYSLSESQFIWVIDATSTPLIEWSESPLTLTVAAGTATAASVEISVSQTLSNVQVSVDSVLAPFISIFPEALDTLNTGATEKISLWVSVPADTPLGTYNGTIYIKQGTRTLARPLSIALDVIPLADVETPTTLTLPSADRIVTEASSKTTFVKDEIVITLAPTADPTAAQRVAVALGGHIIGGAPDLRLYQIKVPADDISNLEQVLETARSMDGVATAHRHFFVKESVSPVDGSFGPCNTAADFSGPWTEDSPSGCNWGQEFIKLPSAWNLTTGSKTFRMAVIDSGFYENKSGYHADFYDDDPPGDGNISLDFLDVTNSDTRLQGHGTFVTGLIAAKGNNGQGIAGVMWDADVMVCTAGYWDRVRGKALSLPGVFLCFDWARTRNARVINLSISTTCGLVDDLSGESCLDLKQQWSDILAATPSALIVAAAGNDDNPVYRNWYGISSYVLPAALAESFDNVVAVAASNELQKMYGMSNYGSAVKLAAPGERMFSLAPNDAFAGGDGTSYAAPLVAGVAGLMLSVNGALKPAELKHLLMKGAEIGGRYVTADDDSTIYVLNAYESVKLARIGIAPSQCGPVAGTCAESLSPSSSGLCSSGTLGYGPVLIGDDYIWEWSCGTYPGMSSCFAGKRSAMRDGQCGEISTDSACSSSLSETSYGLCSIGYVLSFSVEHGGWSWSCSGYPMGVGACIPESVTCTENLCKPLPANGQCGPVAGGACSTSLSATSSGLCSAGPVNSFISSSTRYAWICRGANGGTDAFCADDRCAAPTPINGQCGPVAGGACSTSLSATSPGLCSAGTVNYFISSTRYGWFCQGANGGTDALCADDRCAAPTPINGQCGPVAGGACSTSLSATSSGLCSAGTVANFTLVGSTWGWRCDGLNGGSNAACLECRLVPQ